MASSKSKPGIKIRTLVKGAKKLRAVARTKIKVAKAGVKKLTKKRLSENQRIQEVEKWSRTSVTVGIHSVEGTKIEGASLTIAEIMTIHEFGSDDGKIPQRSWLRAWFDESAAKNSSRLKVLGTRVAKGEVSALQAARQFGAVCVGEIQKRWATHPWAPLSESTLARNPNRQANSALTDTGQSRLSVTFKVHQ